MDSNELEQERILNQLSEINIGLESLHGEDIPKLDERIFAGVFVPVFAGEESLYNASIDTWIRYAGSPYKEVDVIDSKGKVLFRVPPIYDRAAINSTVERKVSVMEIVTRAQQFARLHPNQGKTYLSNELEKKALVMKIPANIVQNLEFWNMVFKRYGRPEIVAVDESASDKDADKFSADDFEAL